MLLLRSAVLVAGVRIGLWVLPSRLIVRGVARRPAVRSAGPAHRPSVPQIARAVGLAARLVPGASCLVQALAARALLARYGYSSRLDIGVTRSAAGQVQAHAWLSCDGRVVAGHGGEDRFRPLPPLPSPPSPERQR